MDSARDLKDHNYREGAKQQFSMICEDNNHRYTQTQTSTCKMLPIEQQQQQQQGRVHHRDLGLDNHSNRDDKRGDKISYSAIVNKNIMNKLAWGKTSASSSLMTTATKTQHNNNIINNNNNNTSGTVDDKQSSQTMYRMTSMQLQSNRRYAPQSFSRQHTRSSSTSTTISNSNNNSNNTKYNYKLMTPSLIALILVSSLILTTIEATQALATSNDQSTSSVATNSNKDELKADSDRRDSSDSPSSSNGGSLRDKNSIVASLSSAVASAAAAAVVGAAKSSLSAGDARSLLSSSSGSSTSSVQNVGAHQQRSPALSLALKFADSIPEVPYSILHNMKKLDHAAPFYNVPGKLSSGSGTVGKESAHGFLMSALTSPGAFGGAADQLSALFRSPLWKRISDSYGEFTSEFRSLFRARPTTMKGPSSSTTKLLRDISMPAALMLLASAIPSDWRPIMKNRRKSSPLEPVLPLADLPKLSSSIGNQFDPMETSASNSLRNYSPMPQQFFKESSPFSSFAPADPTILNSRPFNIGQYGQQQQQQPSISGEQMTQVSSGVADINMPSQQIISESVGGTTGNWMSPSGKSAIYPAAAAAVGQQQQQQQVSLEQQLPVKRFGESVLYSESNGSKYQPYNLKPVNIDHNIAKISQSSKNLEPALAEARESGSGLFSSLTSNLVKMNPAKLLLNRIMNANSNGVENHHYEMLALPVNDGHERRSVGGFISSLIPRREHHLLGDKHRYSLMEETDSNMNERKSSLSSSSSSSFASSASAPAQSRPLEPSMLLRRNSIAGNGQLGQEQRDLTQLLPQSWREVVKRTVNSVKQEASTQWRSIEGQLTNWVQDKLKTLPMTPSQPGTAASAAAPTVAGGAAAGAGNQPVSNLIASVSSTAMNMLGLGGRTSAPTNKGTNSSSDSSTGADLASAGSSSSSSSVATNNKASSSSSSNSLSSLKTSALAGVANMIVNTLTNRQPASATTASQKPANIEESSGSASSNSNNLISQYPTLTGAQPSGSQTSAGASHTSTGTATRDEKSVILLSRIMEDFKMGGYADAMEFYTKTIDAVPLGNKTAV